MEKQNMTKTKKRPFFKHYKKIFVNEFSGYSGSKLVKDILAGLTVAAVALPLALAFGAASVGAEFTAVGICAGLITAIVSGIVTGLLGGGSFQISGPTGAMTVVLGAIVSGKYGLQGMFLACLLAGIIMFIAGLLRFGKLIQFIPRPVVTGFTTGIAIVIALGQLGNFFGVTLTGDTTIDKVINFFKYSLGSISLPTVLCSAAVVIFMIIYPKKLAKYVPASLISIILITIVTVAANINIKQIGEIPATLINSETLKIHKVTPGMISSVFGSAITIAALGMIESLLCGTCAANMKKEKFDSNVELIAQGLGNIAVPFLGGVPSTAAIARTSVAVKAGGQTRLTSLFQSIFLIVCMFALSGIIGVVPYAALAGVLVMTAWNMNEWETIKYYFKNKLWDAVAMFLITMVVTVCLDLTYAIIIGVVVSLIIMVNKLSKMKIETSYFNHSNIDHHNSAIVYCTGALFFANAKEIEKELASLKDGYDRIVIVMRGIVYLDVSAVSQLMEIIKDTESDGKKKIYFTGVRPEIMRTFERCNFTEEIGENSFYSSIDKFLLEVKETVE